MQPIRRLLTNATLRASSRRGRVRRRGNVRQRAMKLCALGCLLLLLFAGARPAAAAGICKEGDPNTTVIKLYTEGGYVLQFFLHLEGDKIIGKLFANPAHAGEVAVNGSVNGQFYPGKRMYLTVDLYPPAKPGSSS